MYTKVQKWGNSKGIRIPKTILDALGIRENERVEILQSGDTITVRKADPTQHSSLEERLTEFYGRPLDEIDRISGEKEIDWGGPKGSEQW